MHKKGKKIKTSEDIGGQSNKKIEINPLINYLDECLGTHYHYKEKSDILSEDIISMTVTCSTVDEISHAFDCVRKFCHGPKEDQQLEKFIECIMSK